ncbi:MAG: hypothetical protein IJ373_00225, partial [Clostridia bacterium]|nr:hypothetical protein [Clostridia bacterium]
PCLCATKRDIQLGISLFVYSDLERDLRVGAVLREQNALPYEAWIMKISTAKAAIDNCRAGSADKGATLVTCSKINVGRLARPPFILT